MPPSFRKKASSWVKNQRPITCLNNLYTWFTSCLLAPMDQHLEHHGLMEGQQRGAKSGCFGTMDNLLIDRAVMLDCQRGKRNLSMAWIDVRKAYDSVDHNWLCAMTAVHRLPIWLGKVIRKLCASWNTRVVATSRQARESSRKKGSWRDYPRGTLCVLDCLQCAWTQLRGAYGQRIGGIPVIQAYRSQSHWSPVYRRPEGFCCLRASWTECWKRLEERCRTSASTWIRKSAQWYTWRGEPQC